MRDEKRIEPFMEKLQEIWKANPDWRFSQLLINCFGDINFYKEDDFMAEMLEFRFQEWVK